MRRLASIVMLVALASFSHGQEKKPMVAGDAAEVRFADGSVVKMTLQQQQIDIVTRYGRLSVPANEIRRIEFGLRIPEETTKRIDAVIAKLAASEAKERESASAELLSLRELAYPALRRATGSSDAELARRATDALRSLAESVPADALRMPANDTVVTAEFTITGRVETPYLAASSAYFGVTKLNPADIRNIRWLGAARDARVSVDAAKYGGAQDEWLDTGVEVRTGATLSVTATGMVELTSEGTRVGPDGSRRRTAEFGGGGPAAGGFGGRAGGPGRGGIVTSPAVAGALIGRIGPTGRPFFLGSRYESQAGDDGRLYLRIGASGGEATGSFDVRVAIGR